MYLMTPDVISVLIDYSAVASGGTRTPETVSLAGRILAALSRDPNCFESALLTLFPVLASYRLAAVDNAEPSSPSETENPSPGCRDIEERSDGGQKVGPGNAGEDGSVERVKVDVKAESVDVKVKQEPADEDYYAAGELDVKLRPKYEREIKQERSESYDFGGRDSDPMTSRQAVGGNSSQEEDDRPPDADKSRLDRKYLGVRIIAGLAGLLDSRFGEGVAKHVLKRGRDNVERQLCSLSLVFLCRFVGPCETR